MSNPTSSNLTAICSVGDELGKMNNMVAAHFCYLLCFTHSSVNELDLSRMFLVSSNHNTQRSFYKNHQAIHLTELLEYAKSLKGSHLPHFQLYKFIYALELADMGKSELASEYMLAIQSILTDYKGIYGDKYALLNEVVDEIADRLSVHFSKGASNGNKNAGWFTKGLDSLVSAAVGEALDSSSNGKPSRKYSRSNNPISESDFSMSRTESLSNFGSNVSHQDLAIQGSQSFNHYETINSNHAVYPNNNIQSFPENYNYNQGTSFHSNERQNQSKQSIAQPQKNSSIATTPVNSFINTLSRQPPDSNNQRQFIPSNSSINSMAYSQNDTSHSNRNQLSIKDYPSDNFELNIANNAIRSNQEFQNLNASIQTAPLRHQPPKNEIQYHLSQDASSVQNLGIANHYAINTSIHAYSPQNNDNSFKDSEIHTYPSEEKIVKNEEPVSDTKRTKEKNIKEAESHISSSSMLKFCLTTSSRK